MQMVSDLVTQLGGTLVVGRDAGPGAEFCVTFTPVV
jgi:hypothetical protein